jgi:hypothetical protein
VKNAYLDDDCGPLVIAVEAEQSDGSQQSLWVRVGPVFCDGVQADEPGVWVCYQKQHEMSDVAGPVLIPPNVWRQLVKAVELRIRERETPRRLRVLHRLLRDLGRGLTNWD